MAGQRTRIRFGSVSAEVLLEKTSTKPRAAQHETRRVLVESPVVGEAKSSAPTGGVFDVELTTDPFGDPIPAAEATSEDVNRALRGHGPPVVGEFDGEDHDAPLPSGLLGPMGDPTWPPPEPVGPALDAPPVERHEAEADALAEQHAAAVDLAERADEPRSAPIPEPDAAGGPGSRVERQAAGIAPVAEYVPPATRVEQGVHLEDGTWVDLTDRLDAIDARTRVDGLEVVRTIPASSYASERVREAHYLCGVDPDTFKVLSLLWRALRAERMAAEVRWTKRTAQASGIIVARGELPTAERPRPAVPAHLLLLELEWHAQIKRVPPRARGPIMADVGVDELVAATELVQSCAAPAPRAALPVERLATAAGHLELARAGKLAEYEPPAEPMPEDLVDGLDVELAEAMALAALWNREHAPA